MTHSDSDAHERLAQEIEALAADANVTAETARPVVNQLLTLLEQGAVRAAQCGDDGVWRAVPWVKRGILLGFRIGRIVDMSLVGSRGDHGTTFNFFDKDTFPLRALDLSDGVRMVPGGSSVRRGTYLAPGVVCVPPMYINVGAHVGAGAMIDSHALVGSCAQVGERVHLSAAAQLGGVLEPVNAAPVIIEDDVVIGGNCGVYEGTVVRRGAVLGSGVILTRSIPVFDLVRQTIYRATAEQPLEIPPNAVVVPGARRVSGEWGREQGLSLVTPVIVKYRDARTDAATALEDALR